MKRWNGDSALAVRGGVGSGEERDSVEREARVAREMHTRNRKQ